MSIVLDLIGSTIIAGFIVLIGLRLNFGIVNAASTSSTSLNVQESMVDALGAIESDFRKMGYNIPDPKDAIARADSDHIRFRADMNRDGTIDSVDLYVSAPLPQYTDHQVRVLYRSINGGSPTVVVHNVTSFKLKYLNQDGVETNVLSQIWLIETSITVSSQYKVADQIRQEDQNYVSAFWRQTRLSSRNIKRHG